MEVKHNSNQLMHSHKNPLYFINNPKRSINSNIKYNTNQENIQQIILRSHHMNKALTFSLRSKI